MARSLENKEKKRKQSFLVPDEAGKKKVRFVEEQSKRERTTPVGSSAWESHSKDWIDRTNKETMRVVSSKSKKLGRATAFEINKSLPDNWKKKRNVSSLKSAASRRLGVK